MTYPRKERCGKRFPFDVLRRVPMPRTAYTLLAFISICIGIPSLAVNVETASGAEPAARNSPPRQRTITVTRGLSSFPKHLKIVLVCESDGARTRGLQGYRPLQAEEAALFVFDPPQAATFWMGTVAYPLDIIFVTPQGRVAKVYAGCLPGSRDLFSFSGQTAWVIETAAGSGIREGDRVTFSQRLD